ncbi:MAG: hypothetical protein M5R38_17205 [Candidatus Methylomirabilis sp.]|nr:hypothetical protein [Candidatus Methylomirabilis sp.]
MRAGRQARRRPISEPARPTRHLARDIHPIDGDHRRVLCRQIRRKGNLDEGTTTDDD